jgi:hypothetical protein
MIEFELVPALVGGTVATVVTSAMMAMAVSAGTTGMPSIPVISGSMLTGDRTAATRIGVCVHYLVIGTLVYGWVS